MIICSKNTIQQQKENQSFQYQMTKKFQKSKLSRFNPIDNQLFIQRACFQHICPISIQDDEEQPDQIQLFTKRQISSLEKMQQLKQQSTLEKDIRIKWSQFVKVKQKYYLKQYVLIKTRIGKGSFGTVQKVKSIDTGQIRAAKIILKQNFQQHELEGLHQEIKILKKIDHPHIIKLYEVYDHSKEIVLIMELCTGGQLYKELRGKALSQLKVRQIMKQLLKSLVYLHSQKIVHRDIKPQNIIYEDQSKSNIKLIDFGLSITCEQNQLLIGKCGTPFYMSPQLLTGKYNFKCDIWAAGVTMYVLLTGRTPFLGQNQRELSLNILKKEPDFLCYKMSKITENTKKILKLMLQKDQLNRPSAIQLLQNSYFKDQLLNQLKPVNQKRESQKSQITNQLRTFQFQNKLQAIIQTFIAAQILTKKQKEILLQLFEQFDSNNDGVLSSAQLKQALQKKKNISPDRIEILMLAIDTNGSGEIDYTEFLAAGFEDSKNLKEERLKKVFHYFDSDMSGTISYEEVVEFLSNYQDSEQQIRKDFNQFDVNGDGSISQSQFVELLLNKAQSITQQKIREKSRKAQLHQRMFHRVLHGLVLKTNIYKKNINELQLLQKM